MADVEGVVAGEYGKLITLDCQDSDGNTQNVSSYTTLAVLFKSPQGDVTFNVSGSTTALNYQVSFSFDSDNLPKVPGLWNGMVKLEKTGELTKSQLFSMLVGESL